MAIANNTRSCERRLTVLWNATKTKNAACAFSHGKFDGHSQNISWLITAAATRPGVLALRLCKNSVGYFEQCLISTFSEGLIIHFGDSHYWLFTRLPTQYNLQVFIKTVDTSWCRGSKSVSHFVVSEERCYRLSSWFVYWNSAHANPESRHIPHVGA